MEVSEEFVRVGNGLIGGRRRGGLEEFSWGMVLRNEGLGIRTEGRSSGGRRG